MEILMMVMFAGLIYCIKHIRKLNKILDARGAPPPAIKDPPGKTPRDISRDLMDAHERQYHRR